MSLIPQVYAETIGIPQPSGMQITDIGRLLSSVISLAFIIAGILVFAFLVWGGIEWLTAGGDKARVETAGKMITNALIGLAVLVGSYAIALFIQNAFKINILAPVFPNNL